MQQIRDLLMEVIGPGPPTPECRRVDPVQTEVSMRRRAQNAMIVSAVISGLR